MHRFCMDLVLAAFMHACAHTQRAHFPPEKPPPSLFTEYPSKDTPHSQTPSHIICSSGFDRGSQTGGNCEGTRREKRAKAPGTQDTRAAGGAATARGAEEADLGNQTDYPSFGASGRRCVIKSVALSTLYAFKNTSPPSCFAALRCDFKSWWHRNRDSKLECAGAVRGGDGHENARCCTPWA
jgi:hypothetical protein